MPRNAPGRTLADFQRTRYSTKIASVIDSIFPPTLFSIHLHIKVPERGAARRP
jgi:hypothetical protein